GFGHRIDDQGLQNVVWRVLFDAINVLLQPFAVPAFEDDQTIMVLHQRPRLKHKLLKLDLRDLSLKDRVLYPVQVPPAQFQHFGHPSLVYVVYKYNVHPKSTTISRTDDIPPCQECACSACSTPALPSVDN